MPVANVDSLEREAAAPLEHELLIKEARRRARLRRWVIIVVSLLVAVATTVVLTGGAQRIPPKSSHLRSQPPSRSGATGGHSATTPVIPGGQSIQSVWPVSGTSMWVFTTNEKTAYGPQGIEWTSNGGRTWRNATPANYRISVGRYSLGPFFALSSKRAWVASGWSAPSQESPPTLLSTNDGGRSWSVVGTVPSTPCIMNFSSASNGVCASSNGAGGSAPLALYATHNGGATWVKVFDNISGFAGGGPSGDGGLPFGCDKSVSTTTSGVVWAEFSCDASAAVLYRSVNSGRSWSAVAMTQPSPAVLGGGWFRGPVILKGEQGAVAFAEGHSSLVYVTHDGGRSFVPIYPPGPRRPWVIDVVTPSLWRLAYGNQIIGTNDAGASWFGLSSHTIATAAIRHAETYGIATLRFSTPNFAWMSWDTGSGYLVSVTRNGGRNWLQVAIPGTGRSHV